MNVHSQLILNNVVFSHRSVRQREKVEKEEKKHPKFRTLIADEWLLLINLGQNGHSYMK